MGHMGKDEVVSLHLFFPVRFSELIPQEKKSVKNLGVNLILSWLPYVSGRCRTGCNNKKADKDQSILHDSSILTDDPVGLPNSHKPFPDISNHGNIVWQEFENSGNVPVIFFGTLCPCKSCTVGLTCSDLMAHVHILLSRNVLCK